MQNNTYDQVLAEFRADIFQRLSSMVALFSVLTGVVLVFTEPLPHQLVFELQLFGGFIVYIRYLARHRPNLARHSFSASLYVILAVGMWTLPIPWLPFMVAPLLLVSELLAAWVSIIAASLLLCFAALLVYAGHADYPLPAMILFTLFAYIMFKGCLSTIWTMLHWYRSMFEKNSSSLNEVRTHRAELVQTLKSLEIAHDVQQRLQTQLIYARQQAEEARQMKERFASNISHELRTPLNIIMGFTEIMHLTPEVYGSISFPPKLQQDIYQIHRNSRHLLDMIDDVLDLSHIELSQFSLNFERTNLNQFLEDTVGLVTKLFQDKPIEFIVTIANALPELQVDRTRIRQVLINLLNNAQRFTSHGSVTFCVDAHDDEVIFQVADTGIGIAQDQLHLIFDEFFQVDYSLSRANGGAGLGLAISRRFIEAHNGNLHAESEEGVGSVFTFTLPRPKETSSFIPAEVKLSEIRRKATWLVVDADPHVSKLIQRHTPDCSIIQVHQSEQIEAAISRYSPQGVILNGPADLILPDSIDFPLPVVTCSLPSTTQMIKKLGVNACLSKPMLPQQLIEKLQPYQDMKTILVIDDDVGVVQLVQRSLENHYPNLLIRRAYNGEQACEMMRTSRPDLVLLDLAMPTMSGFEVIDIMKRDENLQNIPIILLTATKYIYSDDETRGDLRIQQRGGLKPMEVLRLLNSITQTVNN
jgi:signal transduction histidine kinase/CheY-like chemotaxis protein